MPARLARQARDQKQSSRLERPCALCDACNVLLNDAMRRAVHRLSLFEDVVPADAVVTLAGIDRADVAELLASGVLAATTSGFRLAAEARALAAALPPDPLEARAAALAHAEWLLRTISSMHVAADSARLFDLIERMLPDTQAAIARLAEHTEDDSRASEVAARLWCAMADLLFYRRPLAFDVPEYAAAVGWADRAACSTLRVTTRIVAGRAAMEVRPSDARAWFDSARALAHAADLRDLDADAARGLGWFFLAEGDLARARALFDEARTVHEHLQNTRGIADACMAQAVGCVLSGDRPAADALFFRAEALLRARRDTVRVHKLESLRAMFGFGGEPWADVTVEDWLSRGQYWRAALTLARTQDAVAQGRARILAELAGVAWENFVGAQTEKESRSPVSSRSSSPRWALRTQGVRRILVTPEGREVDITRRGPLVRMIEVLGRANAPVAPADLFEAAWPGESVRHESALYRVYTTVRRLRALGLPIATTADGYYCEPLVSEA
jgi:hypothetical protein